MKGIAVLLMILIVLLNSCSKTNSEMLSASRPTSIVGKWSETELYGNDYWGGPGYWKVIKGYTEDVKFTADGQYFIRNYNEDTFHLEGSYTLEADSNFMVVPAHPQNYDPANPSSSNYSLHYSITDDGYLILGMFAFEGIMMKKYILRN